MIAREKYIFLKSMVLFFSRNKDINGLLDRVRELQLDAIGESNSMYYECVYHSTDGNSVNFTYKSYDPSGAFQNLPDINKVKIELFENGVLTAAHDERFSDESIYG